MSKKFFSLVVYGYGGQGVKSLASILAKSAIFDGLFAQAFPEFGPERRGAPLKAYVRISTEPILTRAPIEKPNFVVVMDEYLLNREDIKTIQNGETSLLVNTCYAAEVIKKKYNLPINYHQIYCQDANFLVQEVAGQAHVSIPILGKLLQVTEIVSLDSIKDALRQEFLTKIGEKKMQVTNKILEESYQNIQ